MKKSQINEYFKENIENYVGIDGQDPRDIIMFTSVAFAYRAISLFILPLKPLRLSDDLISFFEQFQTWF